MAEPEPEGGQLDVGSGVSLTVPVQPAPAEDPVEALGRAAAAVSAGTASAEDIKDALRLAERAVAGSSSPEAVLDAARRLLATSDEVGLSGRGVLVCYANAVSHTGDVDATVDALLRAFSHEPSGFSENHVRIALANLRRSSDDAATEAASRLVSAGAPVSEVQMADAAMTALQRATSSAALDAAIEQLRAAGGFVDVVAAGKALSALSGRPGRGERHVVELVDLALASDALNTRGLHYGLTTLAERGAVDAVRTLLRRAAECGVQVSGDEKLHEVAALANSMRFEEMEAAYDEHVAAGMRESPRARRVLVLGLASADRADEVARRLLDWATAARAGTVVPPAPQVITPALGCLLRELGGAAALETLREAGDGLPLNATHCRTVMDAVTRSRELEDIADALVLFAERGMPPVRSHVEAVVAGSADLPRDSAVDVLRTLVDNGIETAGARIALVEVLVDLGRLSEAADVARTAEQVSRVALAHLTARDLAAARPLVASLEDKAPPSKQVKTVPYPPELAAAYLRTLAHVGSAKDAEAWFDRYPQRAWPDEAWEAMAGIARRDGGRIGKIAWLIRKMKQAGRTPTGRMWAEWLYAHPRASRAAQLVEARQEMAKQGARPGAAFWTAAVGGALLPAKVSSQPGQDPEASAWTAARAALRDGEELLVEAVRDLARRGSDADSWFTARQLLELGRSYPLRRRPYAQLDAALTHALDPADEPREQFLAFATAVAACHARALLPDGVERVRRAASVFGFEHSPELVAAAIRAASADPEAAATSALEEIGAGHVRTPVAAAAAGEALATARGAEGVVAALDDPELMPDVAPVLVNAAAVALASVGHHEAARAVEHAAEERGIALGPDAQAALLSTASAADDEGGAGTVWSTSALAAYNELLKHELSQPLAELKESAALVDDVLDGLDALLPSLSAEARELVGQERQSLVDVRASLENVLLRNRLVIRKITGAADAERQSAGSVLVTEAVTAVRDQLATDAERAGSPVTLLDHADRLAVRGHATLLQFALHNLVSNALKAHVRAKVRRPVEVLATFAPSARAELDVAPHGWVVLSVRDYGDGVPDDLPDNVANWSMTGQPGHGLGFGLRTTEHMVRDAGGQLTVDGDLPQGSRFNLRLPAAPLTKGAAAGRARKMPEGDG